MLMLQIIPNLSKIGYKDESANFFVLHSHHTNGLRKRNFSFIGTLSLLSCSSTNGFWWNKHKLSCLACFILFLKFLEFQRGIIKFCHNNYLFSHKKSFQSYTTVTYHPGQKAVTRDRGCRGETPACFLPAAGWCLSSLTSLTFVTRGIWQRNNNVIYRWTASNVYL